MVSLGLFQGIGGRIPGTTAYLSFFTNPYDVRNSQLTRFLFLCYKKLNNHVSDPFRSDPDQLCGMAFGDL